MNTVFARALVALSLVALPASAFASTKASTKHSHSVANAAKKDTKKKTKKHGHKSAANASEGAGHQAKGVAAPASTDSPASTSTKAH